MEFLESLSKLLPYEARELLVRILAAVLALAIIWLLRNLLTRLLLPVLRRLVARTKNTDVDDLLLDIIQQPVRLLVIAFAIWVVAQILLLDKVAALFLQRVVATLVIVAIALGFFRGVGLIAQSTRVLSRITGIQISEALLPFLRTGLRFLVLAFGILAVLQAWGIDVNGLLAGLGIGGLAFALAAQDTVANLFGFTTIVGDQPLVVGDYIITPDVTGVVEVVGLRSTRVRQLDQALVTIPNNVLANSTITNWSRLEKRRVNFVIGVTYSTNSQQMRTLLERLRSALRTREHVLEDTVTVLFTEFGDSALNVLVRCYVALPDWLDYMVEQEEMLLEIMNIVEELGLGFAFPSQSVYIEQMAEPGGQDAAQVAHLTLPASFAQQMFSSGQPRTGGQPRDAERERDEANFPNDAGEDVPGEQD